MVSGEHQHTHTVLFLSENCFIGISENPDDSFPVFYSDIMNNKVFYQHPNLMRALGMHETVMEVMVNVLGGGESKVIIIMLNTLIVQNRLKAAHTHRLQTHTSIALTHRHYLSHRHSL